ncbi:Wzz/FepE/Etk N-terminal domain-containing protein [Arthrobacter gengyunqii]|uniref:Polysaccharide chain length determinant N-terminal domain-containing protein n=1 Tax=Arthrobacter gengyunqii TaxID=2886940 RepID=A0A9X1M1T4_9MICC|nr:Wzz/FepE/Etk N-terminal domain-containing protein [Arthrobacter gengyunqii]MCC3269646.1 hypothetical protein [Arthrobacter gengyunqii]UOY97106.1 Wzz/FepE/Etk N-terminal domain-containing protein [Arthrobacter gengyunqii]
MNSNKQLPVVEMGDFFSIVFRRWKTVLGAAAVCGAVGAGLGAAAPETYSASAALTVAPLTTSPFAASQQQVNMATEREVMASREVAAIAADTVGNASPEDLMAETSVAAPSGSQVLKVTVKGVDAENTAANANALAEAYLLFRTQGAEDVAHSQIAELERKISDLTAKRTTAPADEAALSSLQDQLVSLRLVGEVPGRVISRATVPVDPASPGLPVVVAGTVAFGLLAGCGLALGRERSHRLKGARE